MTEHYERVAGIMLVISLLTIFSIWGCQRAKTITNLPSGVSQAQVNNWYTATGAFKVIGDTNKRATDVVIQLQQQQGFLDQNSYTMLLTALGKIAQTDITAAQFLQGVPQNFGQNTQSQVEGYLNQVTAALEAANSTGLAGIKNKDSQAAVKALLDLIGSSVKTVQALIAAPPPSAALFAPEVIYG